MNLYEINEAIIECVDEEGEIVNFEALQNLTMERNSKIENIACYIKNLKSEEEALKSEIKNLSERAKRASNKAESLKKYLDTALNGETFSSSKAEITYRKSKSVELENGFNDWAKRNEPSLIFEQEPKPDKKAIKEWLESGGECKYAAIVEKQNIQIK